MQWILVALFSYLFGAMAVVLDKYLLGSKRISSAPVYAFYIGLLGIGVFIFAPLGFFFPSLTISFPSLAVQILSIIAGIIYILGIAAFYFAIARGEASRITPVVFSLIPIVTYFLSAVSGNETLSLIKSLAIGMLIFGGLLISFELPLRINKQKFFSGFYYAVLAGFLLGLSYVLFKQVYLSQAFYSGFVWTRLGSFLGVFLFLFIPTWRKDILKSFHTGKKAPKKQYKTGGLFIFNKILGGTSSILLNKAISMGSVTAVNAMVSMQYVFVIVIAFFISKKQQKIFGEKLGFWDWAQKISAILIIGLGMYFLS